MASTQGIKSPEKIWQVSSIILNSSRASTIRLSTPYIKATAQTTTAIQIEKLLLLTSLYHSALSKLIIFPKLLFPIFINIRMSGGA